MTEKLKTKNLKLKTNEGFTLIETTLYVGLLSILLVVISNFILGATANYKTASMRDELTASAYQVFGFFYREVKNAKSIHVTDSVLDSNAGALSLTSPFQFSSGVTGQVDFYLSDGRIMFRRAGETALALTPADIEITKFKFARVTPRAGLEGVRFYLDIRNKEKPQETFSLITFVMLRGGYIQ